MQKGSVQEEKNNSDRKTHRTFFWWKHPRNKEKISSTFENKKELNHFFLIGVSASQQRIPYIGDFGKRSM